MTEHTHVMPPLLPCGCQIGFRYCRKAVALCFHLGSTYALAVVRKTVEAWEKYQEPQQREW